MLATFSCLVIITGAGKESWAYIPRTMTLSVKVNEPFGNGCILIKPALIADNLLFAESIAIYEGAPNLLRVNILDPSVIVPFAAKVPEALKIFHSPAPLVSEMALLTKEAQTVLRYC